MISPLVVFIMDTSLFMSKSSTSSSTEPIPDNPGENVYGGVINFFIVYPKIKAYAIDSSADIGVYPNIEAIEAVFHCPGETESSYHKISFKVGV